jgi:hypothetical protein
MQIFTDTTLSNVRNCWVRRAAHQLVLRFCFNALYHFTSLFNLRPLKFGLSPFGCFISSEEFFFVTEISLSIKVFFIYAHLFSNITRVQNENLVYLEAACADPLCELRGFAISQAEYLCTVRATVSARKVPFPNLRSEIVYDVLPSNNSAVQPDKWQDSTLNYTVATASITFSIRSLYFVIWHYRLWAIESVVK